MAGVCASAREIAPGSSVSGSATVTWRSKVTIPSSCMPVRSAASARAAAIAWASGAPFMLGLTSIASTTPKSPAPAFASRLRTVPATGWPFSLTWTWDGRRAPRLRTDSTSERAGNTDPPPSETLYAPELNCTERNPSSLMIVPMPCALAIVALRGLMRFTKKVSSGSTVVSPLICTVTALFVSPGPKTSVPEVVI